MAFTSSGCYFDTTFGRPVCIEQLELHKANATSDIVVGTSTKIVPIEIQQNNIAITVANGELLGQNLTPTMEGWKDANGSVKYNSTVEYLNQSLPVVLPEEKSSNGNQSLNTNIPIPTTKPKECENARELDWKLICPVIRSQMSGGIDCDNANPETKGFILDNFASSSGSWQKRCE